MGNTLAQESSDKVDCVLNAIDEFIPVKISILSELTLFNIPDKPKYEEIRELGVKMIIAQEKITAVAAKEYIKKHPDQIFARPYTFTMYMDIYKYFSDTEIEQLKNTNQEFKALFDELISLEEESEGTLLGQAKPDEERRPVGELQSEIHRLGIIFNEKKDKILGKCN
ncbi:hypothetical protein NBRC116492_06340 [Aurantivibrio infirmus]